MMKVALAVLVVVFFIPGLISCRQDRNRQGDFSGDSINLREPVPMVYMYDTTGEGLPIFYNMYLSVELSSLFESSGAVFNQDLLNSPDRLDAYITSSDKALNLGVYAVDLSYARVFEQLQIASRYFTAMQRLAEELGIPAGYFENTANRFERNIDDRDSLIKIANEVYMVTDNYLKVNERHGSAAQIIVGGWVEAIYIALDIAEKTSDIEIIERLAEQRYSLENLLDMLENYKDDVVVAEYIDKLSALQPVFNSFIVKIQENYDPESASGRQEMEYYQSLIRAINKTISPIRSGIVSQS